MTTSHSTAKQEFFTQYGHIPTACVIASSIEQPLISLFIPTFKRGILFEEALKSALQQNDFTDYEVVVIDNDDCDLTESETYLVIKKYACERLSYYRNQSNLGMTGNWNRGITLCKGQWISMLHDDDWLHPDFLKKMFEAPPKNACILAAEAASGTKTYQEHQSIAKWYKRYNSCFYRIDTPRLIWSNVSPAPGILIKKGVFFESGGFDDSYYPIMDYILYANIALKYPGYILNSCLAYYRIASNETFNGDTLFFMTKKGLYFKKQLLKMQSSFLSKFAYYHQLSSWLNLLRKKKGLVESPIPEKSTIYLYVFANPVTLWAFRILGRIIDLSHRRTNRFNT